MPNWYSRLESDQPVTSRYYATINASVFIPPMEDKFEEKIWAVEAVRDSLSDKSGDLPEQKGNYSISFDKDVRVETIWLIGIKKWHGTTVFLLWMIIQIKTQRNPYKKDPRSLVKAVPVFGNNERPWAILLDIVLKKIGQIPIQICFQIVFLGKIH